MDGATLPPRAAVKLGKEHSPVDKQHPNRSHGQQARRAMQTRKVRDAGTESADEFYSDLSRVASSTECTGLIPSAAYTEDEVDAYAEIYAIPLAKDDTQHMRGQHR